MPRRLSPEERALWAKVVATVQPLHGAAEAEPEAPESLPAARPLEVRPLRPAPPAPPAPKSGPGTTLDGTWDRRLGRGTVQPDFTLDLHGHNLATAYSLLDSRLEQAIASGARVLLLVTGKPPQGEPPARRGKIRAAVGDWLAASRHAGDIAAVRNAHPRHGGAGALYIVLRRKRT
ncbi:MAG TPA: Smr/MutS family protein [Allosphingosinicella sp.]|uniref:Smr/MutS family protein n=1 Tax=Allosphingosinicella sp. TaxID=2823234 RepID=UPI002EDB9B39